MGSAHLANKDIMPYPSSSPATDIGWSSRSLCDLNSLVIGRWKFCTRVEKVTHSVAAPHWALIRGEEGHGLLHQIRRRRLRPGTAQRPGEKSGTGNRAQLWRAGVTGRKSTNGRSGGPRTGQTRRSIPRGDLPGDRCLPAWRAGKPGSLRDHPDNLRENPSQARGAVRTISRM